MNKISCFIITKNDEANIASCINCVKSFASEIILVDTGSNDDTVKIAKSLGAKFVSSRTKGAKAFGESLCKNDWILYLEPDEELSQELQTEIFMISESGLIEKYKSYQINFAIPYHKKANKRRRGPTNCLVRLYNKNFAQFNEEGRLLINNRKDIYKFHASAFYKNEISVSEFMRKSEHWLPKKPFIFKFFYLFFMAFIVKKYFIYRSQGLLDVYKYAINNKRSKNK